MSFGLTNAPTAFTDLMNRVFRKYVHLFVIVFIDEIFMYSSCENDHMRHLSIVFQVLKDNILFAKFTKCERSVAFLGHIVSSERVEVDPRKIEVVKSWPRPLNPPTSKVF